ncbi:MAG: hypothetical protein AAF708_12365 [Deinococcota bacterium]
MVNGDAKHQQILLDPKLDHLGWTPKALDRILNLGTRLPLEEASEVVRNFGLAVSSSQLDRLLRSYAQSCQATVFNYLTAVAQQVLEQPQPAAVAASLGRSEQPHNHTHPSDRTRVTSWQLDGVRVLGQPQVGSCPGLEIKTAVLYPQNAPSERWMLSERCIIDEFLLLLVGFLQEADVRT